MHTIESAFESEAIAEAHQVLGLYRFHLRDLSTPIFIRTLRPIGGNGVAFEQSHFIKTPTQSGPYRPGAQGGDDEPRALRRAVNSIADYFEEAIAAGHQPREDWLVVNESFRWNGSEAVPHHPQEKP